MKSLNIAEEWRKGYEAGYYAGRIDALEEREYDDRTPLQKRKDTEETRGDDDHSQL